MGMACTHEGYSQEYSNNSVMLVDGTWTYCGDHFTMYKNIESQCCIPEINTISYINHKSILKT